MWADMTAEEREAATRAQGRWFPPGSDAEYQFGLQWDRAAEEGAPFELTAEQVLASRRLEMTPRGYAALLAVRNVDDFQQYEQAEAAREQALSELQVEEFKAKLRGAL